MFRIKNYNLKKYLSTTSGGGRVGFTLIELIIVIAIIGIMASAVVLSIGGQTGGAENTKDVGQAAQLRSVALLYAASKGVDYTGLCDAKINNSPVFKSLGNENDTKRACIDITDAWVVIWKEKEGDNYSCIGEKGNNVNYAADKWSRLRNGAKNCSVFVTSFLKSVGGTTELNRNSNNIFFP